MRRAQTSSGKLKRKFYYQFLSIAPGGITLSVRVIETAEVMSFKILLAACSFHKKNMCNRTMLQDEVLSLKNTLSICRAQTSSGKLKSCSVSGELELQKKNVHLITFINHESNLNLSNVFYCDQLECKCTNSR